MLKHAGYPNLEAYVKAKLSGKEYTSILKVNAALQKLRGENHQVYAEIAECMKVFVLGCVWYRRLSKYSPRWVDNSHGTKQLT